MFQIRLAGLASPVDGVIESYGGWVVFFFFWPEPIQLLFLHGATCARPNLALLRFLH